MENYFSAYCVGFYNNKIVTYHDVTDNRSPSTMTHKMKSYQWIVGFWVTVANYYLQSFQHSPCLQEKELIFIFLFSSLDSVSRQLGYGQGNDSSQGMILVNVFSIYMLWYHPFSYNFTICKTGIIAAIYQSFWSLMVNTNLFSISFILLDEKIYESAYMVLLVKLNPNLVEFSKYGKSGSGICFSFLFLFWGVDSSFCSPKCRIHNLLWLIYFFILYTFLVKIIENVLWPMY